MAIKTFTDLTTLPASDINTYLANSGLVFVAETTFSGAANPFINGCFSSDYQNYRVLIDANASANASLLLRVRSGTNTPESGAVYDRYGFRVLAGAFASLVSANQVDMFINGMNTGNDKISVSMDIFAPNQATHTRAIVQSLDPIGTLSCPAYRIETTTAYTGIECFASGGATLTGTMRVYGYRQA
jgi:hypothetical protein